MQEVYQETIEAALKSLARASKDSRIYCRFDSEQRQLHREGFHVAFNTAMWDKAKWKSDKMQFQFRKAGMIVYVCNSAYKDGKFIPDRVSIWVKKL